MADPCDIEASVTSAYTPLVIYNNATWSDSFQFGKPDDYTWDISGEAWEMDVKRNPYDLIPLLHLHTVNDSIITLDQWKRIIVFDVPADVIRASLSPGEYVYDLIMISYFPEMRVMMMHGPLTVKQGVSSPG